MLEYVAGGLETSPEFECCVCGTSGTLFQTQQIAKGSKIGGRNTMRRDVSMF